MDKTTPLYSGKPEDFCWVGFGSGSGTNLQQCAKIIPPRLIFSDKKKPSLFQLEELLDTPRLDLGVSGFKFCGSWKKAQHDPNKIAEYQRRSLQYNQMIVDGLHRFEDEQKKEIDLIVLGGYMRLVKQPLLDSYPDKIINVHPADLTILNDLEPRKSRKFIGADAVYDAILAAEPATRSSVIIVDDGEDHGEIITSGPLVKVEYHFRDPLLLREYVNGNDVSDGHQERQKKESDWPALTTALSLIAEGRIALGNEKSFFQEWRRVYVDGKPMPYGGYMVR